MGTDAGAAYLFDGQTGELLRTFYSPATSRGRFRRVGDCRGR